MIPQGGVYVTGSGFSPTLLGDTDMGLQTTFTRYAAAALTNYSSDMLTTARLSWDGGRLEAAMVGGTKVTLNYI